MKRFAAFLALLMATAAAPAWAGLYETKNVAALIASTPQIKPAVPAVPNYNGFKSVDVRGANVGGFVIPASIDDGFLATGQEVLIVPLNSGGSGGVFTTLLWTKQSGVWKFVGYIPSTNGHLSVYIEAGQLNVVVPVYGTGEPNCCPSKHRYTTYTLNGIRMKQVYDETAR